MTWEFDTTVFSSNWMWSLTVKIMRCNLALLI